MMEAIEIDMIFFFMDLSPDLKLDVSQQWDRLATVAIKPTRLISIFGSAWKENGEIMEMRVNASTTSIN